MRKQRWEIAEEEQKTAVAGLLEIWSSHNIFQYPMPISVLHIPQHGNKSDFEPTTMVMRQVFFQNYNFLLGTRWGALGLKMVMKGNRQFSSIDQHNKSSNLSALYNIQVLRITLPTYELHDCGSNQSSSKLLVKYALRDYNCSCLLEG